MMVGNNSPLYRKSAGFYIAIIIAGFTLLGLLFYYKNQIRKVFKGNR